MGPGFTQSQNENHGDSPHMVVREFPNGATLHRFINRGGQEYSAIYGANFLEEYSHEREREADMTLFYLAEKGIIEYNPLEEIVAFLEEQGLMPGKAAIVGSNSVERLSILSKVTDNIARIDNFNVYHKSGRNTGVWDEKGSVVISEDALQQFAAWLSNKEEENE